ncbi:hypothetical protein HIM_05787 [Hirsutella minnesotensis 3608]|uniref:RNA 3'-terminal phosphate cyclase domain-containing protein n=1 Tax=Hirsutella minnesotensis 3608 TaxID=1043627 RepID=A0A0F7ZUH6_9HYPO|nr:hypothetical protein HIM_05787 [Hirsutella minnesotensis 3608]
MKPVSLDGTTGEGGGQLVRVAVCLAALTGKPITITNIRGNRPGKRGGGLKSQHATSISWLADATDAEVQGLSVGSKTLTFAPRSTPIHLAKRKFDIQPDSSAASALLVLQAILPYVLFASNDRAEPVELTIAGGTNVSWSPSFEYFDQVLMPALEERFGIVVERRLDRRGWSHGKLSRGQIWIKVWPIPKGQSIIYSPVADSLHLGPPVVKRIDASVIVPRHSHEELRAELTTRLASHFPQADVAFKLCEDSGSDARWSVLLVAHASGARWGKDILCSLSRNAKSREAFVAQTCEQLSGDLALQVRRGAVDEHLQDQLIVFQALAQGVSSFPRHDSPTSDSQTVSGRAAMLCHSALDGTLKLDKAREPFGHGSLHAKTVRWVVGELIPEAQFFNKGDVVRGTGFALS